PVTAINITQNNKEIRDKLIKSGITHLIKIRYRNIPLAAIKKGRQLINFKKEMKGAFRFNSKNTITHKVNKLSTVARALPVIPKNGTNIRLLIHFIKKAKRIKVAVRFK